jgi:hypothetical protein
METAIQAAGKPAGRHVCVFYNEYLTVKYIRGGTEIMPGGKYGFRPMPEKPAAGFFQTGLR